MKKTNKRGFTIVELVIVIAVIAILATVLVPTFSGVIADATDAALDADAKATYTQVMSSVEDANGNYIDAENNFVIKATKSGVTKYYYVVNGAFDADNCLEGETEPTADQLKAKFGGTSAAFAGGDDFTDGIKVVTVTP